MTPPDGAVAFTGLHEGALVVADNSGYTKFVAQMFGAMVTAGEEAIKGVFES